MTVSSWSRRDTNCSRAVCRYEVSTVAMGIPISSRRLKVPADALNSAPENQPVSPIYNALGCLRNPNLVPKRHFRRKDCARRILWEWIWKLGCNPSGTSAVSYTHLRAHETD